MEIQKTKPRDAYLVNPKILDDLNKRLNELKQYKEHRSFVQSKRKAVKILADANRLVKNIEKIQKRQKTGIKFFNENLLIFPKQLIKNRKLNVPERVFSKID